MLYREQVDDPAKAGNLTRFAIGVRIDTVGDFDLSILKVSYVLHMIECVTQQMDGIRGMVSELEYCIICVNLKFCSNSSSYSFLH